MTHDHAQVGMHVRKQLNVVEKQSVIVPSALSLGQVTVKDHRHELKRKLLCVKYTKRLMGSISRAVLGQLHDAKINRILAGQRRKSNRAAGGGKHRHHKRRIIVDVCVWKLRSKRPTTRAASTAHSTFTQKTLGTLPTVLKTAHSPRRGTEHQHWTWRTGTTWKHLQGWRVIPVGVLGCAVSRKPT